MGLERLGPYFIAGVIVFGIYGCSSSSNQYCGDVHNKVDHKYGSGSRHHRDAVNKETKNNCPT